MISTSSCPSCARRTRPRNRGARGLGRVWPNPAVGCVLVREGVIVGRGMTQPGGRPHAEVVALAQAGRAARGAVAYVSLEPCAHHGVTAPCTQALIGAGVVRVVTALGDPDPRVSGRGHAGLRAAGIEVVEGVCAAAARAVQAGFLSRIGRRRPMVTLKLALTMDGRIATRTGESRWITGPGARRAVHALRARHDAVLVGAGTARTDDPDLRVRDLGTRHQPVRLVADPGLSLPTRSRLGTSAREGAVWMLHAPDVAGGRVSEWAQTGAELLAVPRAAGGGLDLGAALELLGARGLTRLLCEGGGVLAAAMLARGLVDEITVFTAGHVFGANGRAGIGDLALDAIGPKPFDLVDVCVVGEDTLTLWRRRGFHAELADLP
jgi:diaminohydroxyphosphoribosylaminopyrimidine deaminase/5-amino-6-(5-phosphoribosylamino)uracil reductase